MLNMWVSWDMQVCYRKVLQMGHLVDQKKMNKMINQLVTDTYKTPTDPDCKAPDRKLSTREFDGSVG